MGTIRRLIRALARRRPERHYHLHVDGSRSDAQIADVIRNLDAERKRQERDGEMGLV